jgi:hypothetical protein
VISQALILPRFTGEPEWTGVNNLANFDLLPRDVIVRFIQNGAASYNRPGWLLVDREQPGDWLELFGSAYEVAEERFWLIFCVPADSKVTAAPVRLVTAGLLLLHE